METQLNIQVTSSDVVTLLVNDQVERLQAEHDLLQKQIDELNIEEKKLIRFSIQERIRLVKEKYSESVEIILKELKRFYKDVEVHYNMYDLPEEELTDRVISGFIYSYLEWDVGGRKQIGLKQPKNFKSKITFDRVFKQKNVVLDEDYDDELALFSLDTKTIQFPKSYLDNWKRLTEIRAEIFVLAEARNEISNLLKNKEAIKEKAIAEMTRRLVSRNENLQNDIKEIFSTMGSTRLITG